MTCGGGLSPASAGGRSRSPGAGIWVCAVAAFVTGLVAIVRHHERSWMVVLATALGLLPLVLLVSEIATENF